MVWLIALIGLSLGDKLILDKAEPWLVLISGLLIVGLAFRIFWMLKREQHHDHDHDHEHDHPRDRGLSGLDAHAAAHAHAVRQRFSGRRNVSSLEIAWFGFTGGLLPSPAAIAVLLICLQLKAFTLGIAMVAAFSVGLGLTMVAVGVAAAWGANAARARWAAPIAWGERLPYISAGMVMAVGLVISARGIAELDLFG